MKEVEFRVPRECNWARAEHLIEEVCARRGLLLAMKGTQAKYPGSTHWHYQRAKLTGTLELTLFIPANRIWAQVQAGRKAAWIDEELPRLRRALERELRGLAAS